MERLNDLRILLACIGSGLFAVPLKTHVHGHGRILGAEYAVWRVENAQPVTARNYCRG